MVRGAVDGAAGRWGQRDQDDLAAFARDAQDPVAVFFAEVADVRTGGLEQSQDMFDTGGRDARARGDAVALASGPRRAAVDVCHGGGSSVESQESDRATASSEVSGRRSLQAEAPLRGTAAARRRDHAKAEAQSAVHRLRSPVDAMRISHPKSTLAACLRQPMQFIVKRASRSNWKATPGVTSLQPAATRMS